MEAPITLGNYQSLLHIYNSKRKELSRREFCLLISISEDNSITYNKIFEILYSRNIINIRDKTMGYNIIIDRPLLASFIRSLPYFKTNEDFIHNSVVGAIT